MICILCRSKNNAGVDITVSFVQQHDNVINLNSSIVERNNSEIHFASNWKYRATFSPLSDGTKNTTADMSVEEILNPNITHQKKRGAKIRDSLPGIVNSFG